MKKKILFVGEASYAVSGYGTYAREVLSRLQKTNKYDIAEFASYAFLDDKRNSQVPWRFYVNGVRGDDARHGDYQSQAQNQWGKWRFERVLLDFKPDIVMTIRDYWMDSYIDWSPYRKFFHWVWMPTVDSAPQQEDWIETFINCDGVFTYSDWATEILRKQSNGNINLLGSTPPAVDIDIYKPTKDKKAHKKMMGMSEDCLIVGTVMRNQIRKLYPDLFKAFRLYLDKCKEKKKDNLYQKTYLYVHSSYPDLQYWDFPELLKEYELGNKVLFSYICKNCNRTFCGFFQDARTFCPNCSQPTGIFPTVGFGSTDIDMANIYNLFDVYVQYSMAEGAGMPQEEAAVCGVPVMSTDYSAMSDIVRKTEGFPIKVERMFKDIGTQAYRAYPDNNHFSDLLMEYLSTPYSLRCIKSKKVADISRKYYNWDRTSKIWEDYLDSVQLKGLYGKWESPQQTINTNKQIPDKISDSQFVEWLFTEILGEKERANSLFALGLIRDLFYGFSISSKTLGLDNVNRENLLNVFKHLAENKNYYEFARTHISEVAGEDYIDYANIKDEANK